MSKPLVNRFALLDWLLPYCEPESVALAYPKSDGTGPGWIYGDEDVSRVIAAFREGTLHEHSFDTRTQQGVPYTIAEASRLGLVLHRDGVVTTFCIDFDDHHGDGGNVAMLGAVGRFLGADPVVFTSRSGKGYHAFFRLATPLPVSEFRRWSKGWGFGREGLPEAFPKSEKLTQVWLPNEPNDQGGDRFVRGEFATCIVSVLPEPPSQRITTTTTQCLLGATRPGARNDALNKAAYELGCKGFDRVEAWALCERATRLVGLEPDETATTFASGFDAGLAAGPARDLRRKSAGPKPLTGIGNGERFAAAWHSDARFCPDLDTWFVWDGCRWTPRAETRVQRMAKDTVRAIELERRDAVAAAEEDKRSSLDGAYRAHIRRSATAHGVAEVLNMAGSEPGMAIDPGDLDRDPMLFNCANGTIDLHSGSLRPHRREDLITMVSPASLRPDASCPRWLGFLHQILDGDADVINYIQRAVGYALTGRSDEQCLFFLYGLGQNGKSTLVNTLLRLFGDYGQKAPTDLIMRSDRSAGGPSPDVARLKGMRFVSTSELDQDVRLSEARVKDLTGGDRIVARPLYGKPVEFDPTHTLFIYGNHKPTIVGTDDGIWRRIRLILLPVTIPDSERDPGLGSALLAELDGILAWAVEGCLEWQRDGLKPPESVQKATSTYRAESDPVGRFLAECCERAAGLVIGKGELHASYARWCEEQGETPLAASGLGRRLRGLGIEDGRRSEQRFWINIALQSDGEP